MVEEEHSARTSEPTPTPRSLIVAMTSAITHSILSPTMASTRGVDVCVTRRAQLCELPAVERERAREQVSQTTECALPLSRQTSRRGNLRCQKLRLA